MATSIDDMFQQILRQAVEQARRGQLAADFDEPAVRSVLQQLTQPLLNLGRTAPDAANRAASLNRIGLIAAQLLQYDLAIICFAAAADAAPTDPEIRLHLASAHRFAGDMTAGIEGYRHALRLRPDWPKAIANLAEALDLAGRSDEALAEFARLRHLSGDELAWQISLGTVELHRRRSSEAIAAFQSAIAINPTSAEAHYKLAWALLCIGEFAQGWQQYEWRTPPAEQSNRQQRFPAPQWRGEEINRKTILLEAEQGLGDMIQFVRYAPMLAQRGANVIVEAPPSLHQLLRHAPGVSAIADANSPPPPHDFHVLPMSVPLHLQTTPANIPNQVPYLRPSDAAIDEWRQRVNADTGQRYRVGIAWAGNRLNRNDSRRSCPAECFDLLAVTSGCAFFNLQKPQTLSVGRPAKLDLIDHTDLLTDLAATAALIANLDLVISVDTAIAHLAGAMAKPVWILLPYFADWRWQWDRTDSPWYPTARLFRQPQPGDWPSVLQEATWALARQIPPHTRDE